MEKQQLKELLKNIKENNYVVPEGMKAFDISLDMMEYIGDPDGELRDNLILYILLEWIMTDALTPEEVYKILMIALDENNILKGLGELNDTVFSRAFSVEVVACIIYKHKESLSKTDIDKAFNTVIKLFDEDLDVRGFIEGKGWAHGAAHGADALYELAKCNEIGYESLKKILDSIYKKVNIGYYGYIHTEDDRMITAVKGVLERGIIPINEFGDWIRSFGIMEKKAEPQERLAHEHNVNTFLKSLYFRLVDNYKELADIAMETQRKISRFND